jgi:hypothetical protein
MSFQTAYLHKDPCIGSMNLLVMHSSGISRCVSTVLPNNISEWTQGQMRWEDNCKLHVCKALEGGSHGYFNNYPSVCLEKLKKH